MAWGLEKPYMHPCLLDVAVSPPMPFGDLDVDAKSGMLSGTDVRHKWCVHYGGQLRYPAVIMIHFTTSVGTALQVINEMNHQEVSSHLVVERSGELWQSVPFDRVAFHAGEGAWSGYHNNINECCIGIEVNNLGPLWLSESNKFIDSYGNEQADRDVEPLPHRNARIVNLKELWKVGDPGKFEKIVKKGVPEAKLDLFCYWERFPEEQQKALQRVCSLLLTRYPTIRAIIGHDDYAPLRKFDPGPALRMEKLVGWMPDARTLLPRYKFRRPGYTDDRNTPDYLRNLVISRGLGGGVVGRDID